MRVCQVGVTILSLVSFACSSSDSASSIPPAISIDGAWAGSVLSADLNLPEKDRVLGNLNVHFTQATSVEGDIDPHVTGTFSSNFPCFINTLQFTGTMSGDRLIGIGVQPIVPVNSFQIELTVNVELSPLRMTGPFSQNQGACEGDTAASGILSLTQEPLP